MKFVNYPDCQQGTPPWNFPGLVITDFVLTADEDRLQAFCDRFLNHHDRYEFRAVAPFVHVGINQYPRLYSEYGGEESPGYISQNEYYVMFPVARHDLVQDTFQVGQEITWVFPFIGVDNPMSAISGQTVLGFPKTCGQIAASTDDDGHFIASVSMPGFRNLDPAQTLLPLLTIRSGAPLDSAPATALGYPWSFLGLDSAALELERVAAELLAGVEPGMYSVTNLKQFRDAVSPDAACYQALVRAEYRMTNMSPPIFYDGADIAIFDNAVTKIVETLGVGPGQGTLFQSEMGMSVTGDMWFGDLKNLLVLS